MVKVKPTASQGRITVRSNNDTTIFGIKDNLSEYYAKLAERWANSPDMVNGIDYSSKYYAEKSKESANEAEIHNNNILEAINGFEDKVQVAKDDVEQNRINSINAINNTYSLAMGDMQEKSDEVLTHIESSKAEAVDYINTTKTTILNDIEFVADGEKKEIEDLIDSGKDELKEISATEQAELEEIKEGIINYAGIYYEEITDEVVDVNLLESGYVSDSELEKALATKQDKGDYALASDIPDLTDYVKNTDYATADKGGVIKQSTTYGFSVNASTGIPFASTKGLAGYQNSDGNMFIGKNTLENIKDDYVKRGLTENATALTADEKASAKQWLGYADNTDIMQAIASIPQFSLSIVEALPTTGEKMTLYLVPKEGTNNDVYDEYIWIEETTSFEHLGTTAVDLTDYVKNTDYAQGGVAGVVKASNTFACGATNGYLQTTYLPTLARYNNLSQYGFIGKGTLETVLTQYSKTVLTTEADYNALETKDANTLYLIEE